MFVMGCYGHKLSNGVLFAYHLILGVPGGSSHLAYRRRVRMSNNPANCPAIVSQRLPPAFLVRHTRENHFEHFKLLVLNVLRQTNDRHW